MEHAERNPLHRRGGFRVSQKGVSSHPLLDVLVCVLKIKGITVGKMVAWLYLLQDVIK